MNPFLDLLLKGHPRAEPQLRPWYVFAHEVSLAPAKVTEAAIGQIRLKWWSEAADEVLSPTTEPRAHPAVTGWNTALDAQAKRPAPGLVHAYIEAHALDLEPRPYADFEALRAGATARWGNLLRVGLQVLSISDESHHHAANHVGAAYGIAESLYAVASGTARGRNVHPDFGLTPEKIDPQARAEMGVRTLGQAAYHLDRAMELLPRADASAVPVLRLGLAARALIEAGARVSGDPLALPPLQRVSDTFALRLLMAKARRTYA